MSKEKRRCKWDQGPIRKGDADLSPTQIYPLDCPYFGIEKPIGAGFGDYCAFHSLLLETDSEQLRAITSGLMQMFAGGHYLEGALVWSNGARMPPPWYWAQDCKQHPAFGQQPTDKGETDDEKK